MSAPVPVLDGRASRGLAAVALVVVTALTAAGCGSSGGSQAAAGATEVDVTLTSAGCNPKPPSVAAGPVTFKVTNSGADAVTEAELTKGSTILGERENITPGLSGSFSLRLEPGSYVMNCPNAKQEDWPFTVTGASVAPSANANAALLKAATDGYKAYVIAEVAQLQKANKTFTDAVRAGDVAAAKANYPLAREHYEAIEPVAESFGDLDPRIDARADDVAEGEPWTGYHRLEKALWSAQSLAGMTPVADRLDADIARLGALVAKADYQPAQLGNGASELMDEIGASKVTGEEDAYSHTDLYDFAANLSGAEKAFALLEPALRGIDAALAATVRSEFAAVRSALDRYRTVDGFVDYSTVTQAQRRALSQQVDALAEPLSQVAGRLLA